MLVTVTASRTYTGGPLTGQTVTVEHQRVDRLLAPRQGDEKRGATAGGDTYVEKVTKVRPFNLGNGCGC